MPENVSFFRNRTELGQGGGRVLGTRGARPAWAITVLASVLIFTTVVDVLGNLLVIISVLRNRKLRNAASRNTNIRNDVSSPETSVESASDLSGSSESSYSPSAYSSSDSLSSSSSDNSKKKRRKMSSKNIKKKKGKKEAREKGSKTDKRSRVSRGNVFVVSLAFADLVVTFYPYPLVLYAIFHDGWSLGETQCKVSGFLMGLSVIGSIFNITGIAINRYCYICHSFAYDKLYSYRNTLLLVALIWALTVVAIVPNFFVGSLQYDARIYSCTFSQTVSTSYTITVVVIHFFVPIAVVTFCYLRIWILVIQVRRKVKSEVRPRIKPSDLRNFITMFVVFVLFAICWAPLNFIGLAVAIDPETVAPRIPEWLFVVSYFMAYFNSCLNAIIYGLLNQNFRKEYKRIVMSMWVPRLFFQETSRGGTEGMKSKPSPGLNNNEQVKGETL